MKQNNHRQDMEITELKTDLIWIKEQSAIVKEQVFNYLPSQIDGVYKKIDKIVIAIILATATLVITQLLTKYLD